MVDQSSTDTEEAPLSELQKLQRLAGIPHLPTQFTYVMRNAVAGLGPRAYDWSDKPHRLVYDLCRELERIAGVAQAQREIDRLRKALELLTEELPEEMHTLDEPDEDWEVIVKMRAIASEALSPSHRGSPGEGG